MKRHALATAVANGLAHEGANAVVPPSGNAKRSEVNGPDLTSPDLNFRSSPLHHGVGLGDSEAQVEMMTIEHLDFEHQQPCEHGQHATHHADEPAMFLVEDSATECGRPAGRYFLCLSGWEAMRSPMECRWCRNEPRSRDKDFKIIRVIGGPR